MLEPCGPMPSVLSRKSCRGRQCVALHHKGGKKRKKKKEREGKKREREGGKKKKEKHPEASVFVHPNHCFSRICVPLLHKS